MYNTTYTNHSISDNSPTLLAETLIQVGATTHSLRQRVEDLIYDLNSSRRDNEELNRMIDKYKAASEEMKSRVIKSDNDIADTSLKNSQLEKYLAAKNQEVIVLNVIIDELLQKYRVKSSDKKRIKELRSQKSKV